MFLKMSRQREYLKPNNEETATRLYGNPVLDWDTDASLLRDISEKSKTSQPVNPKATFQEHRLNPAYDKKQEKRVAFRSAHKSTVLRPRIPVEEPETVVTTPAEIVVPQFEPPRDTTTTSPKIMFPKFKTKVEPISPTIKRPTAISEKEISISMKSMKNVSTILGNIDPEKMIPGRIGANKSGYSLNELKSFATELGISVSGKSKKELIDSIISMRKERGLE